LELLNTGMNKTQIAIEGLLNADGEGTFSQEDADLLTQACDRILCKTKHGCRPALAQPASSPTEGRTS